ncbi:MAG: hypothetical protein ABIA04_01840 [Pseudomonadota bacterium]
MLNRSTVIYILFAVFLQIFFINKIQSEIAQKPKSAILIKVIDQCRKKPELKDAGEAETLGYIIRQSGYFKEYNQATDMPYNMELYSLKNEALMILLRVFLSSADHETSYEYYHALVSNIASNQYLVSGIKSGENQELLESIKKEINFHLEDQKDPEKLKEIINVTVALDICDDNIARRLVYIASFNDCQAAKGAALSALDIFALQERFNVSDVYENPGYDKKEGSSEALEILEIHLMEKGALLETILLGYKVDFGLQSRYFNRKNYAIEAIASFPDKGLIAQMLLLITLKHTKISFVRLKIARLLTEDWARPFIDTRTLEEDFLKELDGLSKEEAELLMRLGINPFEILEQFLNESRIFDYTVLANIIGLFPVSIYKEFADDVTRLEIKERQRLRNYWIAHPDQYEFYKQNFFLKIHRQALVLSEEKRAKMAYNHFRTMWRCIAASNVMFTDEQRFELRVLYFKTILNYERQLLLESDNFEEAFEQFRYTIIYDPILSAYITAKHWERIFEVRKEVFSQRDSIKCSSLFI